MGKATFCTLAAGLAWACGAEPQLAAGATGQLASESQEIINGGPCDGGQPASVAVIANIETEANQPWLGSYKCGGVLIAPDTVLTAAHCVDNAALSASIGGLPVLNVVFFISYLPDLSMWTGTVAYGTPLPPDAVESYSYVENPNYDFAAAQTHVISDVALIFLDEPQSVPPAILPTVEEGMQIAVNNPVQIAGWGEQASGAAGIERCGTSFINEVFPAEIQVGGDSTTVRQCTGDSGSPAFMTVQTTSVNTTRVVGVTSHSSNTGDCSEGGFDERPDYYLSWIDQTMQTACSNKMRVWCEVPGVIPACYYDPPLPDGGSTCPPPPPGRPPGHTLIHCGRCDSIPADGATLCLFGFILRRLRTRRRPLPRA
jgi:hypothetical protein